MSLLLTHFSEVILFSTILCLVIELDIILWSILMDPPPRYSECLPTSSSLRTPRRGSDESSSSTNGVNFNNKLATTGQQPLPVIVMMANQLFHSSVALSAELDPALVHELDPSAKLKNQSATLAKLVGPGKRWKVIKLYGANMHKHRQ